MESVSTLVDRAASGNHIEINLGNVLTVGLLALLFYGGVAWASNVLARTNIPVVSQFSIGAQNFLHAA